MQFEKDMASEHRKLFESARALLLSVEGVSETKKPRITTYRNQNGGICHMRTMPHGIDLGFLKGARMMDKFNALNGTGKIMRVLSLDRMDEELIYYYINQALEINASN